MEPTSANVRGNKRGAKSLNTILPYHGEFMIVPVALELSFNYCSHKCAYCFANLSAPLRRFSSTVTHNLLDQYQARATLPARLMQQGYPVCVSNKVDPFATSNYKESLPVLERLVDANIPVMIQTRGGRGVDEAMALLPPSVWYVSITMLDDETRHRIEPGAPTISSRMDLVEKLVKCGHRVVIGLNPMVRQWLPDAGPLLQEVKHRGASGVWIESMHLNSDQINNLSTREVEAMTWQLITESRRRNCTPENSAYFELSRQQAKDMGLEVFSMGQPDYSNFFAPWREVYPNTYPVLQDFVNECHVKGLQPGDPIRFDDFFSRLLLPEGVLPIGQYIGSTSRDTWVDYGLTNQMTYEDMMRVIWQDPRVRACPARMPSFAYMHITHNGAKEELQDDSGLRVLTFNPSGVLKFWYDQDTGQYS